MRKINFENRTESIFICTIEEIERKVVAYLNMTETSSMHEQKIQEKKYFFYSV